MKPIKLILLWLCLFFLTILSLQASNSNMEFPCSCQSTQSENNKYLCRLHKDIQEIKSNIQEIKLIFREIVPFQQYIITQNSSVIDIGIKLLNNNYKSIYHLVRTVKEKKSLIPYLFSCIEASKKDPKMAIAAANSATILVAADIKLNDLNWQGIRIPGAILDHAFLARTDFSGSDCRNVSFFHADLRDTKWDKAYVKGLNFGEYLFSQHPAVVKKVAWSPTNNLLATYTATSVYLWGKNRGELLQKCNYDGSIEALSWSPSGKKIAIAIQEIIYIWDVIQGKIVAKCCGHECSVTDLHWSSDGDKFASASADYTLCIWNGDTGERIAQCIGHTHLVSSVRWGRHRDKIASSSWDKTICIWNSNTGKLLKMCKKHSSIVTAISWCHKLNYVASASADHTVCIWQGVTGEHFYTLKHPGAIVAFSWSKDQHKLIVASRNTLYVWDGKTGKLLVKCQAHLGDITTVDCSYDGKKFASTSVDKTVCIWNIQGKLIKKYKGHTKAVNFVSWSRDGLHIATVSDDKSLRIWDAVIKFRKKHLEEVNTIKILSSDNNIIKSISKDNMLCLWDRKTGELTKHYQPTLYISTVSRYKNKKLAVAIESTLQIWDLILEKYLFECKGHSGRIRCVQWSHNEHKVASSGEDKIIFIWNGNTDNPLALCKGHTATVLSLSWSNDDKKLASGSTDKTVRIWKGTNGYLLHVYQHVSPVTSVCWNNSGTQITTASKNHTIHIWDSIQGNLLMVFGYYGLVLQGAKFQNANGILPMQQKLIQQRGGQCDSFFLKKQLDKEQKEMEKNAN